MLTYAGTSHRLAPLAVREQLTMTAEQVPGALGRLKTRFGPGAILATCNRVEWYLLGDHRNSDVHDYIAGELSVDRPTVERYVEVARGGEAVRHLYAVSAGIESVVVGESEVLGQVRRAFSQAVAGGTDHAVLSHLFHTAIRVGRWARTETAVGRHALSVSSIAVQQARALVPELTDATVLVIGTGEAGRLAAAALAEWGVGALLVANRTSERAEALASELAGRAVDFERLGEALARADVVLAAAAAPQPLVSRSDVAEAMGGRSGRPLLLIDLAMPRAIDAAASELPAVTCLDLDGLQAIAAGHAAARAGEVERVRVIVAAEADRFLEWVEQRDVVPTIAALTEHAARVRARELQKTLQRLNLTDEDEQRVERMTRAIVEQMLHAPIAGLRERGAGGDDVETLRRLFRLDEAAGLPAAR